MSKLPANLLILHAATLWRFGNVAQKTVLMHLYALNAVGLRCLIGMVTGAVLYPERTAHARRVGSCLWAKADCCCFMQGPGSLAKFPIVEIDRCELGQM